MAKTREELEAESTWFDCQESETLAHTSIEDAVCALFDDDDTRSVSSQSEIAVDCYQPSVWTDGKRNAWADWLIGQLIERFDDDEDFAHPDRSVELDQSQNDEVMAAAQAFMAVFSKHAVPLGARYIGSFTMGGSEVIGIVRERWPDWVNPGGDIC